jgi:hypothetical protein
MKMGLRCIFPPDWSSPDFRPLLNSRDLRANFDAENYGWLRDNEISEGGRGVDSNPLPKGIRHACTPFPHLVAPANSSK